MSNEDRYSIEWPTSPLHGLLSAIEPTPAEIATVAEALAGFYNDSHNSAMMAHTAPMTPDEVIAHWAAMREGGARPLLLYRDHLLMGDADLRRIEPDRAELAFLVGARAAQGKGLGTRFGILVAALAFEVLGLERVYAAILPANQASLRSFEKMGYAIDNSPAARVYAEEEDEVTVSIARPDFRARHLEALRTIRFSRR